MKTYIITVKDSVKDDVTDIVKIIDALIQDEEEAINAYKLAIERLPQFKEQLTHIMEEEVEHKKELEALKQ